jgi:hypothetical protein
MQTETSTPNETNPIRRSRDSEGLPPTLTVILGMIVLLIEVIVDIGEWFDIGGITKIIPYYGFWMSMLRHAVFGIVILAMMFRGGLIALTLTVLGLLFYLFEYFL